MGALRAERRCAMIPPDVTRARHSARLSAGPSSLPAGHDGEDRLAPARAGRTLRGGRVSGDTAPVIIEARGGGLSSGLAELWRYRSIAMVLAKRSLKARYRQTLVGVAWVLLQPLVL